MDACWQVRVVSELSEVGARRRTCLSGDSPANASTSNDFNEVYAA